MKYTKSHYPIILIKGMLMGIADLIPGVSGGTIALITGIYKDLISSLNNINFKQANLSFFADKNDILIKNVLSALYSCLYKLAGLISQ